MLARHPLGRSRKYRAPEWFGSGTACACGPYEQVKHTHLAQLQPPPKEGTLSGERVTVGSLLPFFAPLRARVGGREVTRAVSTGRAYRQTCAHLVEPRLG